MYEYPINLAAWEKNAITIIFTWPIFFEIFSAPYKNGTLLIVATDTVIPFNNKNNFNYFYLNCYYFIDTYLANNWMHLILWGIKINKIQWNPNNFQEQTKKIEKLLHGVTSIIVSYLLECHQLAFWYQLASLKEWSSTVEVIYRKCKKLMNNPCNLKKQFLLSMSLVSRDLIYYQTLY